MPAIDHAIDSGAHARAVALLSTHAENLLAQGRMRLLTRWFAALPDATLHARPLLQVLAIWAVNFTRGAADAMEMLERSGCADSRDPDVQAHVTALRPVLLAMVDRPEQAYAVGRERLLQSPTSQPFADSTLANAMALVVATMGEHGEAQRLLDAARRTQGARASMFNRMYSESVEGMLDLREGRIRQATARFRIAVSATRSVSYTHTNGNAWAGVLYAGAMYEANELEEAEQLLNVYLPLARNVGLPDHMILGYVMLSRIAFCRGDIDQSVQALTELEYIGHQRQLPRVVASAKLERDRGCCCCRAMPRHPARSWRVPTTLKSGSARGGCASRRRTSTTSIWPAGAGRSSSATRAPRCPNSTSPSPQPRPRRCTAAR